MGIGCPPLTSVSLLWQFFAILWEKKEKKSLNKEFFENNYLNFPDFDFFLKNC
jgi:hypothetical protein